METVPCVLCHSEEREVVCTADDRLAGARCAPAGEFTLARCRSCGLVSLDPRPTPQEMAAYYPDDYHTPSGSLGRLQRLAEAYRLRQHAEVVRWLARRRPARGRLLDVGCGAGELLVMLRDDGWTVSGVEPSPAAVGTARTRHQLDVFEGGIDEVDLPAAAYDAVVLAAVLEHLHDPLAALIRVRGLLAPGGLVAVLFLPLLTSPQARLFGGRWLGLDVPRHLHHFDPETFARAARQADLRIDSVETYSRRHNATLWVSSLFPGLQKQRLNMTLRRSKTKAVAGAAAYLALTTAARPLARAEASLGLAPVRSYFLTVL